MTALLDTVDLLNKYRLKKLHKIVLLFLAAVGKLKINPGCHLGHWSKPSGLPVYT